jgi:hypothetical protein
MKKADPNPIEDLAQKRRDYLTRKAAASLAASVAGGLSVLFGLIAVAPLLLIPCYQNPGDFMTAFIFIGSFGFAAVGAGLWCKASLRTLRQLPYVPPVSEQVANLPSDRVLVRGSDEPADKPGDLLRAAGAIASESPDELLRPDEEEHP